MLIGLTQLDYAFCICMSDKKKRPGLTEVSVFEVTHLQSTYMFTPLSTVMVLTAGTVICCMFNFCC